MAAFTILPLILLALTPLLIIIIPQTLAQTPVAPAPGPAGPVNLTGILDKNGQYTTFIRLLKQTQVGDQVNNQLNGSTEGMTVLAPTDNAFSNLKAGTLNSLNNQQQVQLVLYHVAPKYYSLNDLQSVPNPVRTQATGQNGGVFGLNFTSQGNQVNVSSGMVETQINNALRQQFPLAVYQVDKVLLPDELFEAKSPSEAPSDVDKGSPADGKNSTRNVGAEEPSPAGNGSGGLNVGFGIAVGLALACMGALS